MLSKRLIEAINDQINYEIYSANIYLSMAAYCAYIDMPGFENWFLVQHEEEMFHAMKLYNYLNQQEARVVISQVEAPETEFDSLLDAFEKTLQHERKVTERFYNLMDLATEEREHATISLLRWFIDEQVEEEASASLVIAKIKRADTNSLYLLDNEMAQRVFVPPTQAQA